ncbi:hypothetical protein JTB14_001950 [Gonioctena quinquepunctata]|nr:hypothetical protein JTB14_001950 [Gonioctena quinquepunctata]
MHSSDDLIEDSPDDPLEEEETQNYVTEEKEKNDSEKLKNIDIVFPQTPPNSNYKRFKNEANSEVSLENNDSDIEDPEEMNGFHFRFPVRIIPYTAVVERFTTPEPQKNTTMSFEMNEPENSRMNSNKTEATTNSHTYELKRNTTEHPNNLRKDEVKNISDANLTIWSSPNKTKTGKPTTTTPHVHSIEKNKPTNHNNDRRPEKTDFRKIWKPSLDTDKNAIANSILSRIFGTVLTSSIEKMKSPKRSRRDIHFNSNRYLSKIVLNNIAKKYIAPKHFPKSDRNLFSITEGSAVQTPPAGFREKNESILRNIVVPDTAENEVMTLADIFNGNYARGVKSKKLKDFSEDFEQIM